MTYEKEVENIIPATYQGCHRDDRKIVPWKSCENHFLANEKHPATSEVDKRCQRYPGFE